MVDHDSATHESRPDAGQPPGEPAEDSVVAELQAELEASLSRRVCPERMDSRDFLGAARGEAIEAIVRGHDTDGCARFT
jgi:hypothetical protein